MENQHCKIFANNAKKIFVLHIWQKCHSLQMLATIVRLTYAGIIHTLSLLVDHAFPWQN